MGTYLSTPSTELETEEGTASNGLMYGVSSMQGWRSGMEDACVCDLDFDSTKNLSLFGVFDGHGGPEVAAYCRDHIASVIKETDSYKHGIDDDCFAEALTRSFFELDVKISTRQGVKEMRLRAMEEDRRRKSCIEHLDLAEMNEAASSCGISSSQLKALISSQLTARLEAKQNEVESTSEDDLFVSSEDQGAEDTSSNASSSSSSSSSSSLSPSSSTTTPSSPSSSPYASLRPTLRKSGVGVESGTTAVVALLSDKTLIVANAGDSRCVLCRNNKAMDMSIDHKPEDFVELTRVTRAGGSVVEGRIEGNLNLSRAIGDLAYKRNLKVSVEDQMITALPDIQKIELTQEDQFVILACDGIWNMLDSEQVVENVLLALARSPRPSPGLICEEILNSCLAPDTEGDGSGCDNMTMMLILLPTATSEGGSTSAAAAAAAAVALSECDGVLQEDADAFVGGKRNAVVAGNEPTRKKVTVA